ncbi:siderophore-interacting protein [Rhodoblastus sp.]|uniref:siderophore-interacting protein n=1 Tax=Rhodoblastus sp. TaxID=1962975 RepID=UPI0035AF5C50
MLLKTETRHQIQRFRQEPKRRLLIVESVTQLTPNMRRIIFTSPELRDFVSLSPDDHIKVFLPDPSAPRGTDMRDYTPRAFDPARGALTIDFALHDAGPATLWALAAKPGDRLEIGGPRGSSVAPDDFDHYLLVGDETALPAIGRRVESLRAGVPVTTAVMVEGPQEVQHFETRADWRPIWLFRAGQHCDDAALLRDALRHWRAPEGDGYVWIAAEARTARVLRDYMIEECGHPKAWLKAAGYWTRGKAGAAEKFEG